MRCGCVSARFLSSHSTVALAPVTSVTGEASWTGTLTLTAVGGPVKNYTVTVDAVDVQNLTVAPADGSLSNGQTVTVTVTAPSGGLFNTATLTISPGNISVTVSYQPVIGATQR